MTKQEIDNRVRVILSDQSESTVLPVEDIDIPIQIADLARLVGRVSLPDIVAAVIRGLQSPHSRVRRNAANASWALRDAAKPAVPLLLQALHDSEDWLCEYAALSLLKIDRIAAVRGLREVLGNPDPIVRCTAIEGLAGTRTVEAVDELVATLRDPDVDIRRCGASSLYVFKNMPVVLTALLQALHDPDVQVRRSAVRAVKRTNDTNDRVVMQGLLEALRDPDDIVRIHASHGRALLRSSAVAGLSEALHDRYYQIRKNAAEVLGVIGDTAAIGHLIAALQRERIPEVRQKLCWALGTIATAAGEAARSATLAADAVYKAVLPALSKVHRMDPSVIVRVQALQALEGLGVASVVDPDTVSGGSSTVLPPLSAKAYQEVADARKQLHTFCLVGEILEEDRIDTFKIKWMAQQLRARKNLPIRDTTLRDHLKAVKYIFIDHLPDLGIIWDTGQGQRGYALTPQWWDAWRIAMQLLGRKLPDGFGGRASKRLTEE